jgi:hypothetical protein
VFSLFKKNQRQQEYHSKFGGLWIDRVDAGEELERRLEKGQVSAHLGQELSKFMADGYLIIPGAVDPDLVDRIAATMTEAFERGDERLRYQGGGNEVFTFEGKTEPRGKRVIEAHAVLPDVREAFTSPPIVEFLEAIFDEPVVLAQSLMFQMGSEQPFHRDTTYVRFRKPLSMVGCWVALEEVRAGSGELSYIVGSHRLPDFPYSSGKKDGIDVPHDELMGSLRWVVEESDRRGLKREIFRPAKGDALIWHADLAHGGSPITDPTLTRQSLVGHLSPLSVWRSDQRVGTTRKAHGRIHYSSTYYNVK